MSATIDAALREARDIEKEIQDFFDAVNEVLTWAPESVQYLIKPIVAGMKQLSLKIAEFWAKIKPYLDSTGNPRKLERYAEVLINSVAKPLNDIAGDIAIERLETNTEWTGSGAEAYKAIVPAQGNGLEGLRDFVTDLGNTLKELAHGIENFWLAIRLALAALRVGIVAAIAEAGSGAAIFASVPTALGAVGLFLAMLSTAVVELKNVYDTIDTSQDTINQGIVALGTEWTMATPRNQIKIDTPEKWYPIGTGPSLRVGGDPGQRRPGAPTPPVAPTEPPRLPATPPPVVLPPPTTGPMPPPAKPAPGLPPLVPPPSELDPLLPPDYPPPSEFDPHPPPVVPSPGGPTPPPGRLDPDLPPDYPPPSEFDPQPPPAISPPGGPDPDFPPSPVTGLAPGPGATSPSSSVPALPPGPPAGLGSPAPGSQSPGGFEPTGPSGMGAVAGADGLRSGPMADAQASGPANQRPAASASGATATGGPNKDGPAGFPLGGMGAGADQKGEDKTHTTNWRVEGQLFGETDPVATFNGVVGTEPAKER